MTNAIIFDTIKTGLGVRPSPPKNPTPDKDNKMELFSIYDKKALEYGPVFVMPNKVVAVREFQKMCQDPKSNFAQFSEDYKLVRLGNMDYKTGKISQPKTLEDIAEASNFAEAK